jgi:hypothetical protein
MSCDNLLGIRFLSKIAIIEVQIDSRLSRRRLCRYDGKECVLVATLSKCNFAGWAVFCQSVFNAFVCRDIIVRENCGASSAAEEIFMGVWANNCHATRALNWK